MKELRVNYILARFEYLTRSNREHIFIYYKLHESKIGLIWEHAKFLFVDVNGRDDGTSNL